MEMQKLPVSFLYMCLSQYWKHQRIRSVAFLYYVPQSVLEAQENARSCLPLLMCLSQYWKHQRIRSVAFLCLFASVGKGSTRECAQLPSFTYVPQSVPEAPENALSCLPLLCASVSTGSTRECAQLPSFTYVPQSVPEAPENALSYLPILMCLSQYRKYQRMLSITFLYLCASVSTRSTRECTQSPSFTYVPQSVPEAPENAPSCLPLLTSLSQYRKYRKIRSVALLYLCASVSTGSTRECAQLPSFTYLPQSVQEAPENALSCLPLLMCLSQYRKHWRMRSVIFLYLCASVSTRSTRECAQSPSFTYVPQSVPEAPENALSRLPLLMCLSQYQKHQRMRPVSFLYLFASVSTGSTRKCAQLPSFTYWPQLVPEAPENALSRLPLLMCLNQYRKHQRMRPVDFLYLFASVSTGSTRKCAQLPSFTYVPQSVSEVPENV